MATAMPLCRTRSADCLANRSPVKCRGGGEEVCQTGRAPAATELGRRPRPRLLRRLEAALPERRRAWGRRSRSGRAAGWFPRVASNAVGVSSFWIFRRVRRSIDASCSRSSAPQSERAVPLAPRRPVRPTRWT